MKRTWKVLLILSDVISWLFWLLAASFLVQYVFNADNLLRHEFGIGMAMGAVYGFWPGLFSLGVAIYFRKEMKKSFLLVSVIILPAFGALFGVYNTIAT
ncbi:MAG: hypothetical protein ABW139_06905 [Candidatus Thiodiazotropha sp. DIVDIV]